MTKIIQVVLLMVLPGSISMSKTPEDISEKTVWLEAIDSKEVLDWVKQRNTPTLARLEGHPVERKLRQQALNILNSEERIPSVMIRGDWVYNFWMDEKNPRGLYRRARYQDFIKNQPQWEILIDIDQLNSKESKSWVFRGCDFYKPDSKTCLLMLSDAGRDAFELREFNVNSKTFLSENAFSLPVGKHRVAWSDQDTLLVATDIEKDHLSSSGYPLRVRQWKRGEEILNSKVIYEAAKTDAMIWMMSQCRPEGCFRFMVRLIDYFQFEIFLLDQKGGMRKFDLPLEVELEGVFNSQVYISLKKNYKFAKSEFSAGDLVKFPIENEKSMQLVFRPKPEQSFESIRFGRNHIFISFLDKVLPKVMRNQEIWEGQGGNVNFFDIDPFSDRALITTESPITPPTLYEWVGQEKRLVRSLPQFFDPVSIEVLQNFAMSSDGEKIPYFLIRKKGAIQARPTIITAYGGFQISMFPSYEPVRGKLWLESGGQFVVANIRGGGEFGPRWHQSAIKENRQKAFNDLFAVTTEIQKLGYAHARSTGFIGGSNGGLLAGVAFTQRPELFAAIVAQVPLLEMKRYHKLLAGASWIAEYGNPDLPNEWQYLQKYSPLHNIKSKVKYPSLFLMTSTRDDRVHPAHARKFAHEMQRLAYPFDYFENIEGGHAGAADNTQRAKFVSLMYTFFKIKLAEKE